jgi:DNA-binding response OmpR family regulator
MRVLIADDDPIPRLLAREVVAALGHEPIEAEDGAAAWTIAQGERLPLAILDLEMPGLDGLELTRRLREADASHETFVLVCTGAGEALREVLDAGADDFVTKPVTPEQLRARIVIAERRLEQDAARRRAEAELQRAQWLAGIGETSIALQHEINNPLAAIMSHAELLRMDYESRGEPNDALRSVLESARRIADVIRRLQALREPTTVEYLSGTRMLDLRRDDDPHKRGDRR